jgi:NAD(P)-dependent dehydrogenase (short-subunit alcohol dehydrogenase family)
MPGGTALFSQTDVGKPEEIQRSVDKALQNWGRIDVLVNNAAMMTFKKIVDLSIEEWDTVMSVNLRSVFLFCKLCIPHMSKGAIVNISSVHAHATTENVVPYASSKGAMEAFNRGVSLEYQGKLRINCVAPGAVDTPMLWSNPNVKSGTGHYKYWQMDFELVQAFHIPYLRYGPPYYKTHLGPGKYVWEFADKTFKRLKELKIIPIVDLCHFGVPDWIGNFQNPDFPIYFVEYAKTFAERFPDLVYYTPVNPVNEIFIAATFSGL